jgi:hypothetical protein
MRRDISWWVVVRHGQPWTNPVTKEVISYPPEGFPVSAFKDQGQAERFATASTGNEDWYEAILVHPA